MTFLEASKWDCAVSEKTSWRASYDVFDFKGKFEVTKIKPIMTSSDKWFIVDYGDNWYGLKSGDGISRGVPEGSIERWKELILAMRSEEEFYANRLAYEPGIGISSPKNTNHPSEKFKTDDDANLIELLLNDPSEWREDNSRGKLALRVI